MSIAQDEITQFQKLCSLHSCVPYQRKRCRASMKVWSVFRRERPSRP